MPIGAPRVAIDIRESLPYHKTFYFTGKEQPFVVPSGVKRITVVALGAAGGGSKRGRGGRVYAEFPVMPGERLAIFVGGTANGNIGGFNGGGAGFGEYGSTISYGGGGASDIREGGDKLQDRILVVGGGGGEGEAAFNDGIVYGAGGEGGCSVVGSGKSCRNTYAFASYSDAGGGGGGGTHYAGGNGGAGGIGGYENGYPGTHGVRGKGGSGGQGASDGGGGGGGYYGGGGGGGGAFTYGGYTGGGGGGGGGSSYITPRATKFRSWQGWYKATENGLVVFDW